MGIEFDRHICAFVAEAALTIPLEPEESFLERKLETAFVAALRQLLPRLEVAARRKFWVPDWDPQPGGLDVFVLDKGNLIAAAELKVDDVDQCLWDIYKMAALGQTKGRLGMYAVVAAPAKRWASTSDCVDFFTGEVGETRRFDSLEAFGRNREAWRWLLIGGRARPVRVPKTLEVVTVVEAAVRSRPTHELRAIRVRGVPESGWLDFAGDWPEGLVDGRNARA